MSQEEINYLTYELRKQAVLTLPEDKYTIYSKHDSSAVYVTQGTIGNFGKKFTITIELYETASDKLISNISSESEDIEGLLGVIKIEAKSLFQKILDKKQATAPMPVVKPEPKPVSVVQALSGSSLSKGCVEDFTNLLEKDGFDMANFMKELPPAVAKVKLQMKSPFGKPKDSDKIDVGLTVGCIKSLPESPAEIQSLLKDISLKIGLDLAVDATAGISANMPATNNPNNAPALKNVIFVGLIASGLGTLIYGISQNSKVNDFVNKRDGENAVKAERNRNIGYGVGTALLAGGLIVFVVF
jgi:hypothetical protein